MDVSRFRNHGELVEVVGRTHKIFCGLTGSDIKLTYSNPPGRTDVRSFISIPIEDRDADLILKHEWSHIFFRTDLAARDLFVSSYLDSVRTKYGPAVDTERLGSVIHTIINGLDDIRVNSLWKQIYPKSAEDIEERWRKVLQGRRNFHKDLVFYILALSLGIAPRDSKNPWETFRESLLVAIYAVRGQGFVVTLSEARKLLDIIIHHLVVTKAGAEPMVERLVDGLTKSSDSEFNDTFTSHHGMPNWASANLVAKAGLGVLDGQEMDKLVTSSKEDMESVVKQLMSSLPSSMDSKLMEGIEELSIIDIGPDDVEELKLGDKDKKIVDIYRHSFAKLMDSKRRRLTDSGVVLRVQAFMDMILGSGDENIFDDERQYNGFGALVLIDMSGSITPHWNAISRACKVLSLSMNFPFSTFEVWGFTSSEAGQPLIYRFTDPTKGYSFVESKKLDRWGMTPLHIASKVAVRRLRTMPGNSKHLFILSDAKPSFMSISTGMLFNEGDLRTQVSATIREGRRYGIDITGMVLGKETGDEAATEMFGPKRWTRIDNEDALFRKMTGFALTAFAEYLSRS